MQWVMQAVGMDVTTTNWMFVGKGRLASDNLLSGTCKVETFRDHVEKGGLAYKTSLEIRIAEGRNRDLVIKTWSGDTFGESLTRVSIVGEDYNFPIIGHPHPYTKRGALKDVFDSYIGPFKLPKGKSYLLEGVTDGHIFLALLALEMYIKFGDLTATLDFSNFSMPDFSKKLEKAIQKTGWGD
ncbi:MAG: hypothetical protein AAB919_01600 [Patescibacteria group bacterium]